jgi:exosortase E/protease (VPEID-CTERM system)
MGLMLVFVPAYLWCCRRELRFPASIVLIPAGVVSIWFLNVIRIAALILIGGWSERIAIDGFHSVAGWLFYTLAVCAVVVVSRVSPIFSAPQRVSAAPNPAAMYLAPILTVLLIGMLSGIAAQGFDFLYPLKVAGAAAMLWFYRKRLGKFLGTVSWSAVILGAIAFVVWIALTRSSAVAAQDHAFAIDLGRMSPLIATGWLVMRVVGAVVTVPIVEELAFRGYILRKLVSADFDRVDFRFPSSFTWLSFMLSSALFGLLHTQWIAGTAAGMIFAIAMYRRGALRDAVVAHSTANAMLAAFVLTTHRWSLWQ